MVAQMDRHGRARSRARCHKVAGYRVIPKLPVDYAPTMPHAFDHTERRVDVSDKAAQVTIGRRSIPTMSPSSPGPLQLGVTIKTAQGRGVCNAIKLSQFTAVKMSHPWLVVSSLFSEILTV